MGKYFLTSDAKDDLLKIREYTLSQWGDEQSIKYIIELRETLNLLSQNPLIGKLHTDIDKGVYSFPCASHVFYYLLKKKRLTVFGILHRSMVPEKHLEDRAT